MSTVLFLLSLGAASATEPTTTPAATTTPAECAALTGDAKTKCETEVSLKAAQAAVVALGDCAKLTGDAKTQCDTKKKELDTQIAALTAKLAPPADAKSGKATRSNTNRLEAEDSDE